MSRLGVKPTNTACTGLHTVQRVGQNGTRQFSFTRVPSSHAGVLPFIGFCNILLSQWEFSLWEIRIAFLGCDKVALPNLNQLLVYAVFLFDHTATGCAVRPTLLRQMDMGSVTCVKM